MSFIDFATAAQRVDTGTASCLLDVDADVAVITLNRPEKLNALTPELVDGLATAWRIASRGPQIRAIVLTGAGRSFCAGADLEKYLTAPSTMQRLMDPFADERPDRDMVMRKPVIAAIDGPCLGGGLTLLLSTDIRLSSARSIFGLPEVGWGVLAGFGGTQRLLRQISFVHAMGMLVGGERLNAERARDINLINQVVEGNVLDAAIDYARRVAKFGPLAVQATKEMAMRSFDMSLADGIRMEDFVVRALQDTADYAEGLTAWSEKRDPEYKGH